MLLTEEQKIALSEFMKIVLSQRTAQALSELIGFEVGMKVSEVSLSPLSKLTTELSNYFQEDIVSIHQMFQGKVEGEALLILNYSLVYVNHWISETVIIPASIPVKNGTPLVPNTSDLILTIRNDFFVRGGGYCPPDSSLS